MHSVGRYVMLEPLPLSSDLQGQETCGSLAQGQEVEVLELSELRDAKKTRARLSEGWFTLRHGGARSAVPREEWHSEPQEVQDDGRALANCCIILHNIYIYIICNYEIMRVYVVYRLYMLPCPVPTLPQMG